MVYEIKCYGLESIYVGQTRRHVITSISEHQKKISQVGQHLVKRRVSMNDNEWKYREACRTEEKLMTIEAIYISKLKAGLKTLDEFGDNNSR